MRAGRIRTFLATAFMRRFLVGCLALVTLLGLTRGTQDAVANGDTRTLEIIQMHTGERVSVTFRRNGRYDRRGLEQLNWVMRDWRRDEATEMDPRLYDLLWEVHRSTGSRQPVHVVSAYRAPQTNEALRRRSRNVAQQSQHTVGRAVDFYLPDVPAERIRTLGLRMQRGGVGYYPRANTPFVHLDTGSVRHWPRMTRQQLVNVFPDQRTVHIPSDGKPLAGFDQARREILAAGGTVMGETGTATASRAPQGRSFWARLFGGGEDSDQDMAEAQALTSDSGWVNPSTQSAQTRRAPPIASRQTSPQRPASAPAARSEPESPAPAARDVPLPPVIAERPQPSTPEPEPREETRQASGQESERESERESGQEGPDTTLAEAIPLPPPRPQEFSAPQETTQVADAGESAREAGPQLVWNAGPPGLALPDAAEGREVASASGGLDSAAGESESDENRIAGFVPPLPPPRPGAPGESIGPLVRAFAAEDTPDATADALAQLGLRESPETPAPEEQVAALAPPLPPMREVTGNESSGTSDRNAIRAPESTASLSRREGTGTRNPLNTARDAAESYRSLFNGAPSRTRAANGAPGRVAALRARPVEPGTDLPARVIGSTADPRIAGGFAPGTTGPMPGSFAGRAAAPVTPLR